VIKREMKSSLREVRRQRDPACAGVCLQPKSPRSSGLTTIAADHIWCGELVEIGW